jgi:quinol monooxygenase YgiN
LDIAGPKDYKLFIYQIKIVTKPYKTDEFVHSINSFSCRFRKEKGCLGYKVYRDHEKENTFSVVGEWKTRQAMEKHFQTNDFEVLIGAARVLGETFAMSIAEVSKTGGIELAREQIASQGRRSAAAD